MADVVGRVKGFCHRTHGHRRHGVLLGRTFDLGEELVQLLGHGTPARGLEDVPEAQDELPETVELLFARLVVHAVDHRAFHGAPLVGLALAAELGDTAVCQQHELLDHLVRFFLLLEIDADGLPSLVELEFHLLAVEADGSVLETLPAQRLCQSVEGQNLFGEITPARFDDLLRLGIGEPAVGVDHRPSEPFVEYLQPFVDREYRRETEARLVRAQRAELVRQPLGQHRDGAVYQVDRRAAFDGLVVDHRMRAHVVRHVGDMHADFPYALPDLAYRKRVVEVLGVGRVDREGRHIAEIAAPGDLFGRNPAVDTLRRLFDLGLEAVGQFVFGQDGVHLGVVVARHAQALDQLAHGALAPLGPVGYAHDDLFAVLHVGVQPFGEVDVHRHTARVGAYEYLVRPYFGDADIGFAAAFDDACDLALHLPVAAAVHDDHLHAVAVQGVGRVALVDEDIFLLTLDAHVDRPRGRHVRHAFEVGQVLVCEAVFLACALLDDAFVVQPSQDLECFAASLFRGASRGRSQMLE